MNADAIDGSTPCRLAHDAAEVARLIGVGKRTLYRLVASGHFPRADVQLGRIHRWRRSTIENWLSAPPTGSTATPTRSPLPAEMAGVG